jgi:hypothetical protein
VKLVAAIALAVFVSLAGGGGAAWADADEDAAKTLFADGNQLLGKGDYQGALAKYREAYAKFPNAVILLNMGTALSKLGRYSEAIDAYRAYLASDAASEAKKALVKVEIDALDSMLGGLTISVSEPGVKVKVDGKLVGEQATELEVRLDPGSHQVSAAKPGFKPWLQTVQVTKGGQETLAIKLVSDTAITREDPVDDEVPITDGEGGGDEVEGGGDDVVAVTATHVHKGRLGALLRADIQGNEFGKGAVMTIGLTYGIAEVFDVTLAGIVGNTMGVYAGGTFYITKGSFRPFVAAGVPVYFAEPGTMVGIHGAAGIQYDIGRRAGLLLGLGVELFPGPPEGFASVVFVPSLGLQVRM